jgi:hypothetical protein
VSCTWRGTSPRSGSRRTCCLCRRSGRVRSGSRMSTCTQSPRGKSADASSISCHSRRCRLQRARGGRYYPFVRARSWAISIVCSPVSGCDMSRSLTLNRFAQVRSSRARCRLTRRCCCVAFVTATTCSTRARNTSARQGVRARVRESCARVTLAEERPSAVWSGRDDGRGGADMRSKAPAQGHLLAPQARWTSSRGGGTRTPGLRFWRPPLYQLSYAPRVEGL